MTQTLDLTPDELLTTTRAVRRRLDYDRPVPLSLVEACVRIAIQAPSGSNARSWHFMVVGDTEKKAKIADYYRQAFEVYRGMPISAHALADKAEGDDVPTMKSVVGSAEALAANLHRAPYLVIPCIEGRSLSMEGPIAHVSNASQFGSVLPAFWSFMLAARARGLGTSWTTLHLMHEEAIADLLGIPFAQVMQTALSPLAFTIGTDFAPARGRDIEGVLHVDTF